MCVCVQLNGTSCRFGAAAVGVPLISGYVVFWRGDTCSGSCVPIWCVLSGPGLWLGCLDPGPLRPSDVTCDFVRLT